MERGEDACGRERVSRGDFILEPPSAPLTRPPLSLSHPMRCANQMFLL